MKTMTTLAVAAALLLAACGDSDSDDDTSTTSETPATSEAPAPSEAPATTTAPVTEAPATTEPSADAAAGGQSASGGFSLYDFRYCEILLTVVDEDGNEVTEVWGTPGVDPCTDEARDALDPAAIQAENEASFIDMNGPRHFIVDGTVDIGGGQARALRPAVRP